jgi:protein-disulfide isomerase
MRRYALPLIILGVTLVLILLIAVGSSGGVNYSAGRATAQPLAAEWLRGNPQSKVVVVEYSDFQCPACRAYEPLLAQVVSLYADKVAFVYRQYPLYQIHPNADLGARASEAAGAQGKFWEMHNVLFAKQSEWSVQPNAETFVLSYAKDLGVDVGKFKTDLSAETTKQAVADDYARGTASGVNGTPSFVINGVRLTNNPRSLDEFKAVLDAELAK